VEQASACLFLNCIVTQTKVKRKQAEACSTQTGRANDKPQMERGGTLISHRVPPRWGSVVSLHASPQLPLWATLVSSLRDFPERRGERFDLCWKTQETLRSNCSRIGLAEATLDIIRKRIGEMSRKCKDLNRNARVENPNQSGLSNIPNHGVLQVSAIQGYAC
jgi:hypothetical protein